MGPGQSHPYDSFWFVSCTCTNMRNIVYLIKNKAKIITINLKNYKSVKDLKFMKCSSWVAALVIVDAVTICQNDCLAVDGADTATDTLVPGAMSPADATVC